MSGIDPRLKAFLSDHVEIFHSIQHRHEIWRHDPFDVESVHEEARAAFERQLVLATTPPGLSSGRILLLLGDSGCGKTHLIRAFRNLVHEKGQGFVGYLQMTTATNNYGRYVLSNLIESLDHSYDEQRKPTSGLQRLSDALQARCGQVAALLAEPEYDDEEIRTLIDDSADALITQPPFKSIERDLLRALLYLQRDDARIKSRVLKFLRCEDLSESDRAVLGGMVPWIHDDHPQRMVEQLGRVMNALGHALVLCVDQLEDMVNFEEAEKPFRRAMQTLCTLADRVPSSVIVICCLENFWDKMRMHLTRSWLDRIEQDPELIVLNSVRTVEEARQIVARRLAYLYEREGAEADERDPTYPFPAEGFEALSGLRTRDVLDNCRRYRERAARQGSLPERFPLSEDGQAQGNAAPPAPVPQPWLELDQSWNDFRTAFKARVSEEEADVAELLAWALQAGAEELDTGHRLHATAAGEAIQADLTPGERLYIAVCNSDTRGGGLSRQIEKASAAAKDRKPVIVRTTAFPGNPRSKIAEQLGKLISAGGRRTVLEDSEARTLLALRAFREQNQRRPELTAWLREAKPVTHLKAMRDILDLEHLAPVAAPAPAASPTPPPRAPEAAAPEPARKEKAPAVAAPAPVAEGAIRLGVTEGLFSEPVVITPDELTRHAAFLGGSGSGKTTLALNVVEQLLLSGIPAILVDRKGDLAGYASEEAWRQPIADPARAERRARLHERIDVALFTPGHPHGRPLAIPIVPPGLEELAAFDREQAVGHAAEALGGMLDYKDKGRDKQCRTVLAQAMNLLIQVPGRKGELAMEHLIQFVESQDPVLMNAVGRLDAKLLNKLVQDLETLKLNSSTLLASGGERLDMDLLLGRGVHARPGRTRLSVVSTRFLGDSSRILFWVSQLLIELTRWTSRAPASSLQAVVMLDEADMYLPAIGQPATKQPIENLLKRARSAGLGMMLATQSPGDFDYKCRDTIRTWFVGRVKENTALQKMKPMLSEARVDATGKIATQGTGAFHVLRDGKVVRLRADPSCLSTAQLGEDELLRLAQRTRPRSGA